MQELYRIYRTIRLMERIAILNFYIAVCKLNLFLLEVRYFIKKLIAPLLGGYISFSDAVGEPIHLYEELADGRVVDITVELRSVGFCYRFLKRFAKSELKYIVLEDNSVNFKPLPIIFKGNEFYITKADPTIYAEQRDGLIEAWSYLNTKFSINASKEL